MFSISTKLGIAENGRGVKILSQISSTLQACKNSNLRSFSMSIPRVAPTNDTNRATSSSSRNHNVSTPRSAKQGLPSVTAAGAITTNRYDSRRFLQGRNYAPKNLNLEHIYAERRRRTPPLLGPSRAMAERNDEIFKLGLRPGHVSLHDDSYKNPVLLSNYVSVMGRIKPRRASGLTQRSQREVAKAIRRAQNMGLMPVMSKMQYKAWSQ